MVVFVWLRCANDFYLQAHLYLVINLLSTLYVGEITLFYIAFCLFCVTSLHADGFTFDVMR